MKFTKATYQGSRLENGSYSWESQAQCDDYYIKTSCIYVPFNTTTTISSKIVREVMGLGRRKIMESGVQFSYLSNHSAPPYYNITPTTTPQHRLITDSSILNPLGFVEPSLQSFGIEPSQSILALQKIIGVHANFAQMYFSRLFHGQGQHIIFFFKTDYYDLRATHFFVPKCGRVWRLERTMIRTMTRELEQLVGGVIPHYKGVRWRPERKHPWVAEIKISKRKTKRKMWIGNYDTPEEAARAHDVVAIQYGMLAPLNFEDSCKHVPNSTMHSIMSSDQESAINNSFVISTSQSMPLGTHTLSLREPIVQARAMPTCAFANQDCEMNHALMQSDLQENSKAIITLEKYATLKVIDPTCKKISIYNKNIGVVDNGSKSYFMFASDLPSMVNTSNLPENV
jgi:hypothetical protein